MSGVDTAKSFFFTTTTVKNQLDRTTRRVLSKLGAHTRRRAKSSLKYKDGPSAPGKPPHVHKSAGFTKPGSKKKGKKPQPASPLRELTYFAYDPADKSVVIGPAIGGPRSGAPETVEEGGTARIDGHTVTIRPRPWVLPAFKVELKAVGNDLRDTLKG
ncbi:MAG TPA: hypothetical protein VD866_01075 [Urbifossiella sp.]|nr:hypothetical protein [Urbifossiella sp.]